MSALLALALLQAASSPASPPKVFDLACVKKGGAASATLAFHVDLPNEKFTVTPAGAAAQNGRAGSYSNTVVLELPSDNPGAVPMFFIDLGDNSYTEVRRAGASEMTTVAEGTCKLASAK